MSLSSAANNALSGITAATQQVDVTANNIANATTDGYARREVDLSAISLNGVGAGVRVEGVSVATVENLTNDRRRAEAELAKQETLTNALAQVETLVGGVDDPGSLFARYDALETSLRQLTDQPESAISQAGVVNQAKFLAQGFNDAQAGLQTLRENADAAIAKEVEDINAALRELDRLNAQVQRDFASNRNASEAINQRQIVADRLAGSIPIKTRIDEDGAMRVFTTGGAVLVDLSIAEFSFTPSPTISADQDYRGGVGTLSGLTMNGADVTPGAVSYGGVEGGSLAALFEVRDGIGVEFQTQIDALAGDLIDRFDDPVVEPGLATGAPGLFTDAGAANSGAPGLAGRLAVNAAVDPDASGELYRIRDGIAATAPGVAGDNTHAIELLNAFTAPRTAPTGAGVFGIQSSSDLIAEFSSVTASNAEAAELAQATRAARYESLSAAELSATGVDLDYELQNLQLIERAYAANAQVLAVIDELMNLLLRR